MIKRLTRHGNSYALVIDKAILELLRIDPTAPLELTTDGESLVVRPVVPVDRDRQVTSALERVNAKHGGALRRLAE